MDNDLWQRAEEIFHAALERPRESRPAFLNEACGENAELRRRVEKLSASKEGYLCGSVLRLWFW